MQDRTPQIAEYLTSDSSYTGNHPIRILRYIDRTGARGATTSQLMSLLDIRGSELRKDFEESMEYLIDLDLIWSKEYENMPQDKRAVEDGQVWRAK